MRVRSAGPATDAKALALYLTGLAAFVGLYLPQPILPLLGADFDVGARRAALVISATILGIALASPVIGVLSDRFGRYRMLVLGSLGLAFTSLACSLAPGFEWLVAFRFLQGLLLPTLLAVGVAYVSETTPVATMHTVAGIYVATSVVGGMLGRVLAGAFADLVGWRWGFVLSALLYFVLAVAWGRLPAPRSATGERTLRHALRGTLGHLGNRSITAGILMGFFLFFAFQATFTYLPFRLRAEPFGFSNTVIGIVYVTYTAGVISSTVAAWLSRATSLRIAVSIGFLLAIAGNALALSSRMPLLVPGLVVLCFGNWLVHGLALGYVATSAKNDRAGANALYLLLYYLGGSLGAFLPGFLFPVLGFGGVVATSIVALAAGLATALLLAGERVGPQSPLPPKAPEGSGVQGH